MKPIINVNELEFVTDGPSLPGRSALVSSKIGPKKLGYNVSICPPGKSVCPFHILMERLPIVYGSRKPRKNY